jgi:hypothetical protein
MAESWDTKVLSYALGDPGGDNKQLFLLRAPSAAFGGGLTILSGEAVQGAAVANSLGVGAPEDVKKTIRWWCWVVTRARTDRNLRMRCATGS